MERLTNKREADAQREGYERRLANGYQRSIPVERFLRLAAYEDSGCAPEEVLPKDKADEIALKLMRLADLESLCSYDRLRELAEADRDGRLVVLPAKTVFELTWDAGPDCDLICPVSVDGEGCCSFCDKGELCIYERKCRQEHIEQIGKTVFLTSEEAEAALEAKRDGSTSM